MRTSIFNKNKLSFKISIYLIFYLIIKNSKILINLEILLKMMKHTVENYTSLLRHETSYWLIGNDSTFFNDQLNPFGKDRVPIMCDFLGEHNFPSFKTYESGNRSILLMQKGRLLKAKGIGIPTGVSKPKYENGKIYTYQLYDDPDMCHKSILWGFMQDEEFNCELYGAEKARELGQKIKLVGTTSYRNVYYIRFKDRVQLFDKLHKIRPEILISDLKKSGDPTTAHSVFFTVPSDIRVGELFYTLMFPEITDLIDPEMIREYVNWLGSHCGHLLRQFHDSGSLHGTWVGNRATSLGLRDIHSNSYTGNYLVDNERLTMCDFDLSKPIEKESEKEIEKWALVHVENPLYYAGSYTPDDALKQRIAKKNPFREELAALFEKAVDYGYSEEPMEMERSLKREMLGLLVRAKKLLWYLYGLPEDLIGQIYYIDHVISKTKIEKRKLREAVTTFGV